MSNGATESQLFDLQGALLALLLTKLKDGTITAAEMAVARALLKDNNIQVLPQASPDIAELGVRLPTFDPNDRE